MGLVKALFGGKIAGQVKEIKTMANIAKDPLYKSNRMYAGVIMLIVFALKARGIEVTEGMLDTLSNNMTEFIEAGGAIISFVLVCISKYKESKK